MENQNPPVDVKARGEEILAARQTVLTSTEQMEKAYARLLDRPDAQKVASAKRSITCYYKAVRKLNALCDGLLDDIRKEIRREHGKD
jgi:hypothetical protein